MKKKKLGKNKRDEVRLNTFFIIYCHMLHKNLTKEEVNEKLNELKNEEKKFKNSVEKIKNFNMIENIFK